MKVRVDMTIMDLKEQIIKNELSNFYIFVGEEIGIMNIYLNQMSKVLGLPITRAESVSSIYSKCTTKSMFGSTTGFYVIRDEKELTKQESLYQRIEGDIGKNVIVLLYDKIDTRLKFGKFFKDKTVQFEKLTPAVLKSYIKKECSLSDSNCEKLIELCHGSYDLCMLEVDKINQFSNNVNITPDKAFISLLNDGAIYQPEEVNVFQFSDAVCSKHWKQAFKLEKILRENGNSSINILGVLYSSFKNIMLIQCCEGSNISEITGLDNKQIYFNKRYCGKYTVPQLVDAVKLLAFVIEGVKNGRIEDSYATRYALANIC